MGVPAGEGQRNDKIHQRCDTVVEDMIPTNTVHIVIRRREVTEI
jgi:hypothetical protein